MSVFGLIVVFTVVWWVTFFAVLPWGVRREENPDVGHDPGAPSNPMLWRKAAVTTVIAIVIVGGGWLLNDQGIVDFGVLVFGESLGRGEQP